MAPADPIGGKTYWVLQESPDRTLAVACTHSKAEAEACLLHFIKISKAHPFAFHIVEGPASP